MKMWSLLAAVTLIVAAPADAQALTNIQKVSWPASTKYTNGVAIPSTVAVTYNVYAKLGGAAEVRLFSGVSATTQLTAQYPVGQNNCYTITVLLNGGNESDRSPEGCGAVGDPKAAPVTTVVIQSP